MLAVLVVALCLLVAIQALEIRLLRRDVARLEHNAQLRRVIGFVEDPWS
jgi:hypothetical protein